MVHRRVTGRGEDSFVGLVVVCESCEYDGIAFYLEDEHETTDMNSFVFTGIMPEVLEVLDGSLIAGTNLLDLFLNSSE